MTSAPADGEVTVTERVRPHDLVLFAVAIALLVAVPWMLMSAGSDPVSYRDAQGTDTEMPSWLGLLVLIIPFLAWPAMKAYHLVRAPAAAIVGPRGIRLYSEGLGGLYMRLEEPSVDLPWDEIERVVLWRLQRKWLGFIPVRQSQVGVEKTTDWYGVTQREPSEKQRKSAEVRPDGSPVRLGAMLNSRSVRLGPHGAKAIAEAAARFAPRVAVVDERVHGESPAIAPEKRSRKRY